MAGYVGNVPVPQATQTRDNFTATSGQTTFATSGYTPGYLDVYLNGVHLDPSDYTATNGSDVVLGTGATTGDVVTVVAYTTFTVAGAIDNTSVTTDSLTVQGSADVQGTVTADGLTVDGASVFNQAASDQSGGAAVKANGTAYGTNKSIHAYMNTSNASKSLIYAENGAGSVFNVDGSGDISFYEDTGTTPKLFWDASAESLGIGTTSPSATVHVARSGLSSAQSVFKVIADKDSSARTMLDIENGADINFTFHGHVIKENGNVGIGMTSPSYLLDVNGNTRVSQVFAGDGASTNPSIRFTNASTGLYHPTGTDALGFVASGSERMRIDVSGDVLVGRTTLGVTVAGIKLAPNGVGYYTTGNDYCMYLNRQSSDGALQYFAQANTVEGNISVSGSTVSYNGGHLSRWSRLADDRKDTSIVKGTVMTNLDAMVEWGDEDNEQLNKMAVSSVEGDANVAGVFVNWDEDDDWNDMNIAMTGDMVIRIAQSTTVQRGDLLMSAGDGTAKPQGDDIVRSKTIAKVTSTHVSHTYDDGSYLVPCVLMAC